jgi:DNA topoisomerase-1
MNFFWRKRAGTPVITKGKIKIELSKDVDATKLTRWKRFKKWLLKKHPAKKLQPKNAC